MIEDIMNGVVLADDQCIVALPEHGLMFWQDEKRRKGQIKGASPQCNGSEAIARDLSDKMYPWADTRFYPLVLVPIDHRDYC